MLVLSGKGSSSADVFSAQEGVAGVVGTVFLEGTKDAAHPDCGVLTTVHLFTSVEAMDTYVASDDFASARDSTAWEGVSVGRYNVVAPPGLSSAAA